MFAEDMYVHDDSDPAGDIRFGPDWVFGDWLRVNIAANILGDIEHWLAGADDTTYFGAVFRHQSELDQYLVAIRGTESGPEWIQNTVAAPDVLHGLKIALTNRLVEKGGSSMPHPDGGFVPAGFYGIYESMTLGQEKNPNRPMAAQGIVSKIDAMQKLNGRLAQGATVTVVGHSLGAAVGSYLANALAKQNIFAQVNAYFLASPRAGDEIFVRNFTNAGVNCVSAVYERDLVPRVPPPPLYMPFAETVTIKVAGTSATGNGNQISAAAAIQDSLGGNHHVICYTAMLSLATGKGTQCYGVDKDCVGCISTDGARPMILPGTISPSIPWSPSNP
jgi:hypothetical protein